jgi:hypothetical protein
MPQISLYIDAETDRKMRKAARAAGISRSRWASEAIRSKLGEEWPESVMKLAGAWKDFPTAGQIRKTLGRDAPRKGL